MSALPATQSQRSKPRHAIVDDKILAAQAAAGDKPAFALLVKRHYDRAVRVAFGIVGDRHEAEDVVQDAFMHVYRRLDAFAGSAAFYTWLYRIVVNVSIDAVRKRRRERRVDLSDEATREAACAGRSLWPRAEQGHPDVDTHRRQLREKIGRAFDQLPHIHRSVILLREVEGHSYEEIAEELALKKGTVMSRLFHARRSMQRFLIECEAEEQRRLPEPLRTRPAKRRHAANGDFACTYQAVA